ncbi:hypothetical protein [Propionivibrio sp.]|uniref:hypothetical protein n=1 Tax=Propionivibrio sp. TaxID=2212460 RepID=UPI003BF42FE4
MDYAMGSKSPSEEYVERAKRLSNDESERLLSRMRGRFSRRMENNNLSTTKALALQLEYEDEGLAEWRERMAELKKSHEGVEVNNTPDRIIAVDQ